MYKIMCRTGLVGLAAVFLLAVLPGCQSEPEMTAPPIQHFYEKPTVDPSAVINATTAEPDPDGLTLEGITFAKDTSYIVVSYRAPYSLIKEWWKGDIYVVDEATGMVYDDIVVMPVVGPIFNKPQDSGKIGFVMLNDPLEGVKTGSVVTVVLGKYKREHVKVG